MPLSSPLEMMGAAAAALSIEAIGTDCWARHARLAMSSKEYFVFDLALTDEQILLPFATCLSMLVRRLGCVYPAVS